MQPSGGRVLSPKDSQRRTRSIAAGTEAPALEDGLQAEPRVLGTALISHHPQKEGTHPAPPAPYPAHKTAP